MVSFFTYRNYFCFYIFLKDLGTLKKNMLVYSFNTIVILLTIMHIIQLYYNNTKIEKLKKHISQTTTFLSNSIVSNTSILGKYTCI